MTAAQRAAAIGGQSRAGWRAALYRRPMLILGLLFLLVLLLSLFVGRYPAPYWMSPATLWEDDMARQLVLQLRLPRVLTACLLGMTLAACGTVLQMIFRNPLVAPGLLGVSQGAAFGAAVSIIFLGASRLLRQGVAALFACPGPGPLLLFGPARPLWRLDPAPDAVGHRCLGPVFVGCGHAQVPGRSIDRTARPGFLDAGRAVGRHLD